MCRPIVEGGREHDRSGSLTVRNQHVICGLKYCLSQCRICSTSTTGLDTLGSIKFIPPGISFTCRNASEIGPGPACSQHVSAQTGARPILTSLPSGNMFDGAERPTRRTSSDLDTSGEILKLCRISLNNQYGRVVLRTTTEYQGENDGEIRQTCLARGSCGVHE